MSHPDPTAETLPNPRRHALETTDYRIHALCARHDITVEGIVALVDKLFAEDGWYLTQDGYPRSIHEGIGNLRRLARGEEA